MIDGKMPADAQQTCAILIPKSEWPAHDRVEAMDCHCRIALRAWTPQGGTWTSVFRLLSYFQKEEGAFYNLYMFLGLLPLGQVLAI